MKKSSNMKQVPPLGKGSLYIRPLLMGTGASLNLAPAPEYTLLIYCAPVTNYHKVWYKESILLQRKYLMKFHIKTKFQFWQGALNLKVESKFYRAISGTGGTGGIKSITNYAPVSISIPLCHFSLILAFVLLSFGIGVLNWM